MNIQMIHSLGLTVERLKTVMCSCGSKNLSTAYFLEDDQFHITCKDCGNEGIATSHVAARNDLSILNIGTGSDGGSDEISFAFLDEDNNNEQSV